MDPLYRWLDRQVPTGRRTNPHVMRHARLLGFFGMSGAVTALLFFGMYGFALGAWGLGLVVLAAGLLCAAVPLLLRHASLEVCTALFSTGALAAIGVGILTRGDLSIGALVWLVVVPMTPFYLNQQRVAIGTALASGVIATAVWLRQLLSEPTGLVGLDPAVAATFDWVSLVLVILIALAFARQTNAEWRRAVERENEAHNALASVQRLESVGRLAGGVAHDFNNVLTSVLNHAELAREMLAGVDGAAEVLEDLEAIADGARRGGNLARQLLVASRQDSGTDTNVRLNQLVEEQVRTLRDRLGAAGTLEVELEPHLPSVRGDRHRLQQVLTNLVVNARDALQGHGQVRVSTRLVSDADGLDVVEWRVSDNGVGMDEATLAKAVEPFFTTKAMGDDTGTGLGLWTARGVVEDAGGTLDITSRPGEGSTVCIRLPVSSAQTERHRVSPAAEAPAPPAAGAVLVVEDEVTIRRLVSRILTRSGYDVVAKDDGATGLAEYRQMVAQGQPPALVLTDVMMPGMAGSVMASEILAMTPHQPIAFMSGFTGQSLDAQGCSLQSQVPLLQKPFDVEELVAHVERALHDSAA